MEKKRYNKPMFIIVDLSKVNEVVANARCNGGAWNPGGCS